MWITPTILFGVLVVPARLAGQKQIRYAVSDIGTLGGTFSRANGINNNGAEHF